MIKAIIFRTVVAVSVLALSFSAGCGRNEQGKKAETAVPSPESEKSSAVSKDGWIHLFDGTNFDAWQMTKPDGWIIEDGAVSLSTGGAIWTKERFGDFELDLEFKVSPECNSGIFFRTGSLKDPVQTGIEMQVLDSGGKPNPDKHDCGAMYDLLEPGSNQMKSAGEWNHVTITCRDNLIAVVMNGTQIIDMDVDKWTASRKNPDGSENKFKKALKDFPRDGYIGLQDHGHPVWYRNVKIKRVR